MQSGAQEGVGGVAQLDLAFFRECRYRLRLLHRQRERLLAVNVFAGLYRLECHSGMDCGNGEVHDQFDVGHGQNGSQVAGAWDAILGGLGRGALQVEVGTGQHDDIRKADEVRQILIADIAAADDSDSNGIEVLAHDSFLSNAGVCNC